MNATATRLFDTAWRDEWCNGQAAWDIDVLHLIGHPVSAATWHQIETLYFKHYSPDEAAAAVALS